MYVCICTYDTATHEGAINIHLLASLIRLDDSIEQLAIRGEFHEDQPALHTVKLA